MGNNVSRLPSNRREAWQQLLLSAEADPSARMLADYHYSSSQRVGRRQKKRRIRRKSVIQYVNEEGETKAGEPRESMWWFMYVQSPQPGVPRFEKTFRQRFRLPYQKFRELAEEIRTASYFSRWTSAGDATNRRPSPIELLLLGSLRYLGRGWTFDDIEELTAISRVRNSIW